LFEFWSEDQIRRICKSLEEQGAILVGNYNKEKRDRTAWYTVTDCILANADTHSVKSQDANGGITSPLPDIKHTDNKPDKKKKTITPQVALVDLPFIKLPESFRDTWKKWCAYARQQRLARMTVEEQLKWCEERGEYLATKSINTSINVGWRGLYYGEKRHIKDNSVSSSDASKFEEMKKRLSQ